MAEPPTYGPNDDQIDEFFERKREWSRVKDKILGDYIVCYLRTVKERGRPIILIDAFAGPGRFADGSEGSPLIVCKAIEAEGRGATRCIFADIRPAHRDALALCIRDYTKRGFAETPLADFTEALNRASEIGVDCTLFFYLDPWGLKELQFSTLRQIYERDTRQSTEVLINFSFRTFMRMSGNWSYGDAAREVDRKVKSAKVEIVDGVMGGDYWRAIVADQSLSKTEREDAVIAAYLERIREFFAFAYSIPVKVADDGPSVPSDDVAKYHLIFGSRNGRAVRYMNDVAMNASKAYREKLTEGVLFDMTPSRYQPTPIDQVKSEIINAVAKRPMKRGDIYEAIIPNHFLQYRVPDYRQMIEELTFKESRLFGNPLTMRRKGKLNEDTLLKTTPWPEKMPR